MNTKQLADQILEEAYLNDLSDKKTKEKLVKMLDELVADERVNCIEEVDRLIETHIHHSFSICKRLSGSTLDELDLIRQQLNQLKEEGK